MLEEAERKKAEFPTESSDFEIRDAMSTSAHARLLTVDDIGEVRGVHEEGGWGGGGGEEEGGTINGDSPVHPLSLIPSFPTHIYPGLGFRLVEDAHWYVVNAHYGYLPSHQKCASTGDFSAEHIYCRPLSAMCPSYRLISAYNTPCLVLIIHRSLPPMPRQMNSGRGRTPPRSMLC